MYTVYTCSTHTQYMHQMNMSNFVLSEYKFLIKTFVKKKWLGNRVMLLTRQLHTQTPYTHIIIQTHTHNNITQRLIT